VKTAGYLVSGRVAAELTSRVKHGQYGFKCGFFCGFVDINGNTAAIVGESETASVALGDDDGNAEGDAVGIIVAEGLASPNTCSPLLAIVNFRVKVTLSPLLSSVVTVMT
jgi:hypothetical protein